MRKSRSRRKKFKKLFQSPKFVWWAITGAILLCLAVYLAKSIYDSPLFLIKNIYTNEEIEEGLKKNIIGSSLFKLDIKKLHKRIVKFHPEYKKIVVIREFPSVLRIKIKKRTPFAQWKGKRFHLIDQTGVIINQGKSHPFEGFIPVEISNYRQQVKKGSHIKDSRINEAFRLIEEIKKKNFFEDFNLSMVNPTSPQSLYFLMDDIKVIVGEGNFARKIYLLENLLKGELKDKLLLVKYIDLRYKKVYVGFKR